MFERENYIAFVGQRSGGSYASGLKSIEARYAVSIDQEYDTDQCSALLSKIEQEKKRTDLSSTEMHKCRDYASHLKKYVEYRNQIQPAQQRELFIQWMSQQPQKDDPSKRYSETTVKAAADRLQTGIKAFGVKAYENTNCFTIVNQAAFSDLKDACYAKAEEADRKQGNRGFRNGLDFYLKFLQQPPAATTPPQDKEILKIIDAYKGSFAAINREERYKWEAIGWYQRHWNMDAEDFAGMLEEAFRKAGNLLASDLYYPYKMLKLFAVKEPETVRALFRMLYDNSISLETRFLQFRQGFDAFVKPLSLNHYQDLHAVSVYLTFAYPELYYIYKYKVYKAFRDRVGFAEVKTDAKAELWKVENYNRMCDQVLRLAKRDPQLIQMSKDRLDASCYQDEALHLLAMDVVYFGSHGEEEVTVTDIGKNTILYGPPGTGKTYHAVIYAVAIVESRPLALVEQEEYAEVLRRYRTYKEQGRIEFTTFHQSYGYEEFIEGIKPVVNAEEGEQEDAGEIQYSVESGVFKLFCEKAARPAAAISTDWGLNDQPNIWKVSLEGTGDNPTRAECLESGHIRIGWDEYGPDITDKTVFSVGGKKVLNTFMNRMKIGDLVLSCYSATTIDAIGVVTGAYEWDAQYSNYKRLRKVRWLAKEIRENIMELTDGTVMTLASVYQMKSLSVNDVLHIAEKYEPAAAPISQPEENYVFMIDEINRGNISKIFGELIALIEPSKRTGAPEEMTAKLPYSQKQFGVPDNVYLIGTMNTADRSIAAIDTALRRRFFFREMLPDVEVLSDIFVVDLSIADMLGRMNQKISVLYDREHTIGHAYFIPLKDSPTIETLASIFSDQIVPLLQEYFYEDYEKIRLVLGDNRKTDKDTQFIVATTNDYAALFGDTDFDFDAAASYEINPAAFENLEAYRFI